MIRARSTRLVGSVRDREISCKRCRCSASVGSAITRRGATTGSPNPIPPPRLLPPLAQHAKSNPNILIFWNLYTRLFSLGLVDDRDVRRDLLLLDQPVQHGGRSIGRIGREPLRFDSQPTPHSTLALLLRVGSFRAYRESEIFYIKRNIPEQNFFQYVPLGRSPSQTTLPATTE